MTEYETYFSCQETTDLTFTSNELKTKERSTDFGYGIRALENGRLGFAYTQDVQGIKNAQRDAKKAAKQSPKSDFEFAQKVRYQKIDLNDPKLQLDDYESYLELIKEAHEEAAKFGGNTRINLSASRSKCSIENTCGFEGKYEKTYFSAYVETMMKHGSGSGFAYISTGRKPKTIADLASKAARMARNMSNAKKPKSGKYSIVMEVEALAELLEILMPSFSGDWKRRKITKLVSGHNSFSEQFTLYDDPFSSGIGSRPFDDEGTKSRRIPLVEKGAVSSFIYDRETAALAKTSPKDAGSCLRTGYDSPPTIGNSNLLIKAGKWKNLADLGNYLEIHSVHGSHTANATSGDFGLEANAAFEVKKGQRIPIRGFMISGNVFDFFKNIEGIESSIKTLGNLSIPRMAFKEVKII